MPSQRFPGDQRAEVGEVSLLQGGGEGRVYPHSCSRMRDRFDPRQQAHQEHLQLLDRRVFEHFLLQVDSSLQQLKEANLPQIGS